MEMAKSGGVWTRAQRAMYWLVLGWMGGWVVVALKGGGLMVGVGEEKRRDFCTKFGVMVRISWCFF